MVSICLCECACMPTLALIVKGFYVVKEIRVNHELKMKLKNIIFY